MCVILAGVLLLGVSVIGVAMLTSAIDAHHNVCYITPSPHSCVDLHGLNLLCLVGFFCTLRISTDTVGGLLLQVHCIDEEVNMNVIFLLSMIHCATIRPFGAWCGTCAGPDQLLPTMVSTLAITVKKKKQT